MFNNYYMDKYKIPVLHIKSGLKETTQVARIINQLIENHKSAHAKQKKKNQETYTSTS